MMRKLLLLFGAALCLGCSHQGGKDAIEDEGQDTIFVTYTPYIYETSVSKPCTLIAEESRMEEVELVVKAINAEDYDLIADFVRNAKLSGEEYGCDSRVHVRIGDSELCLTDLTCACNIDDKKIDVSKAEYAMYQIKHLSGYFNCLDSLDILYDDLLKKFGVPNDYVHIVSPMYEFLGIDGNGQPYYVYVGEDVRRVALVCSLNK